MRDSTWQVGGWEVATPAGGNYAVLSVFQSLIPSFCRLMRHFVGFSKYFAAGIFFAIY